MGDQNRAITEINQIPGEEGIHNAHPIFADCKVRLQLLKIEIEPPCRPNRPM